jgi:putative transposase
MNTRKIANEYRLSQWSQIFSERCAGENIEEFCARTGISKAQYFYWQRKLRETACEGIIAQNSSEKSVAPNGWVVCELPMPESKGELYVEIGKTRIKVTCGTNPELLRQVCTTLVTLC